MANGASVEVHGVDELLQGSRRLFDRIAGDAPDRFEQVANDQAAQARAAVPRRTGRLAGSITAGQDRARHAAWVGYDGSVPYAGWIEFGGTRGRLYQPDGRYLFPAALDAGPQLERAGQDGASAEIRRFRWPNPRT